LRALEEDAKFRAAVREGIGQADRGELIDDEEVRKWLEERDEDPVAVSRPSGRLDPLESGSAG
jgi:hypothetical protein